MVDSPRRSALGESLLDLRLVRPPAGPDPPTFVAMAYIQSGQTEHAPGSSSCKARSSLRGDQRRGDALPNASVRRPRLLYLKPAPGSTRDRGKGRSRCAAPSTRFPFRPKRGSSASSPRRTWRTSIGTWLSRHTGAAIEAAGSFVDLRQLGAHCTGGLSSAYKQLGQMDTAARYATRSVALLEVLRDPRRAGPALRNELGLILMARGGDDRGGRSTSTVR